MIIKEKLVPESQINEFISKLPEGKIEFGYSPEDVEKEQVYLKEKIKEIAHKISTGNSVVFCRVDQPRPIQMVNSIHMSYMH